MCMICHNGPAILGGVPAAGLVLARVRQALGRTRECDPADDQADHETLAEEVAA